MIARPARRSWVGYGEEPAGQCNVVGPVGIGEEAVVTDAMKSVGQDMDQEAADELVGVERHKLIASAAMRKYRYDHVHLRSSDPDATARFFETMFGAEVTRGVYPPGTL